MKKSFYDSKVDARFVLCENELEVSKRHNTGKYLRMIWNRDTLPLEFLVDDRAILLDPNQVLCLTYLQNIRIVEPGPKFYAIMFNREFYCIHANDREVSCNGLLFFGSNITPVITVDEKENSVLQILFDALKDEFDTVDVNQEEMLRILLKRLIIRCTRLARKQWFKYKAGISDIDTIRQFTILVEENYKSLHKVSDYAALINKSPKTITNTFSLFSDYSPLQIIHERIILEAKRQLLYTVKSIKEICHEMGFEDPAQFSKLFKNITGTSAVDFRKKYLRVSVGQY